MGPGRRPASHGIGTVPRRRAGGLFDVKPTDAIVADTEENGRSLRRAVGALDLTALGVGAIIGTGIFVIIGEAIGKSGPAIVISFALAGVTCLFSALSYAELAAMIPVSGAPTPTRMRRWASSSPGSSAGT